MFLLVTVSKQGIRILGMLVNYQTGWFRFWGGSRPVCNKTRVDDHSVGEPEFTGIESIFLVPLKLPSEVFLV